MEQHNPSQLGTSESGLQQQPQLTHASNDPMAKQLQTFQSHHGLDQQPQLQFMSQQQASVAMQARQGGNLGQPHIQPSNFGAHPGASHQSQYPGDAGYSGQT